jgi:serine protease inhibitor
MQATANLRFPILATILAACLVSSPMPAIAQDADWIGPANNAFAAELYGKLAGGEGNLFFSPNSIETALAMTCAGVRGKTATQMTAVLHLPAKRESLHKDVGEFLKALNAEKTTGGEPRGYQLSVANALWGQKGLNFLPDFLSLTRKNYGAGLNEVDFKKDTEGARKTINAWVEKQTHDKIKDLIRQGMLTSDSRLVLTNAIYFKGTWAAPFEKSATRNESFHLSGAKEVPAPMMHRTGTYGYVEQDSFQALKLTYGGKELSMVVLLPRKLDGLGALEKSLTAGGLTRWLSGLDEQKVVVSMPKFKVTAAFELNETLKAMGMTEAFSDSADFSGMTGGKDLAISNVIHKAFVDVNEEGAEAAAATGVGMRTLALAVRPPPPVFKADHPFIYLIRHEKSGAILFMGRLADPKG